ncbi:MAG: hypothetical protein JNK30_15790 [Phenylobacterium sp.]|uniref:bestrophin-like domain n=1 Tax=Phenylobacterium sp. TaxID=1871053 RepID=UPI001A3EDB99|nr:hypothetical protein [Phenylobacterium sp.]MBL8772843.1 hypothetical protein [Phenylobacterium sp.]
MDAVLQTAPLPVLAGGLFVALLAARELGGWLAGRRPRGQDETQGYVLSGVLGLLALLIAFTFGLALDRYETRRELVVAEASAIGTAVMRVRLLDPPAADELDRLYREYVMLRTRYGHADAARKPPLAKASADLRTRIESAMLAAAAPIRTTPLAALVVPAVNESLDVGVAREAAHAARLPASVIAALAIYALVAAGVLGSTLATAARPHRRSVAMMFLLLTLALGLILDLDRPQGGTVRISQAPLDELAAELAARPPPSAASPPR